MPASPTLNADGSWYFDFPQANGVHYLVHPTTGALSGSISANFKVEPSNARLIEVQPCGDNHALMRLMLQQRGDTLQAGTVEAPTAFQFYRWWSAPVALDGSATSLSVALQPDQWTSVFGKRGTDAVAAFTAALNDPQAVGVTYGGCFAGHGVYAMGAVRFIMTSFSP